MDAYDLKILEFLTLNGRISHEKISKALNLSRPAVSQRIKKMEDANVIKKYQVAIDWAKLGYPLNVFISVKIKTKNFESVAKEITAVRTEGVCLEELHRLAGEWCIMLKIRSTLPQTLTRYIDELLKINAVEATSTTFIFSSIYQDTDMIESTTKKYERKRLL